MKDFRHKQFPPQKGKYILKIKNGAQWYKHETARIHVSVGFGDKHEGEKFAATLNWAKDRFNKVIVCVNDTLQRYSIMDKGFNEKTAYAMAYEAGTKWINQNIPKNKDDIDKIEIIRWDNWIKKDEFYHNMKAINNIYGSDKSLKEAVEEEIKEFLSRQTREITSKTAEFSKLYFLEETAVYPIIFKETKATDIYPGKILLPIKLAEQGKIEGIKAIENVVFAQVDFLRNKKESNGDHS